MNKMTYTFRKLKAGLISVALLGTVLAGGEVLAEEATVAPTQPSTVSTGTTETPVALTDLPVLDSVLAEVTTKMAVETVPAEKAVVGDVLAVSHDVSEPVVTETTVDGRKVESLEQVSTITTTLLADSTEPIGRQEPVVETKTSTGTVVENGQTLQVTEKLTKTTTVEVKQLTDPSHQKYTADIVFFMDHTGSMDVKINAVKENVKRFVSGLAGQGINARLGLVDYDNGINTIFHTGVRYALFDGSFFTTDPAAFIAELDNIKMGGSVEAVTFPLSRVAEHYTWSTSPNAKRFAIVLTDEDYDFDNGAPSVEETIAKLKAAKVSTSVITEKSLASVYQSLYTETGGSWVDISADLATALTKDLSGWIADKVTDGQRIKVVTETYHYEGEVVYPTVTPVALTPALAKPTPTSATLPATGSSSEGASLLLGVAMLSFAGLATAAKKRS